MARKLVRLNDGRLVAFVKNGADLYGFTSVDKGKTWVQFSYGNYSTTVYDVAVVAPIDTSDYVHTLIAYNYGGTRIVMYRRWDFDGNLLVSQEVESPRASDLDMCSMTIDPADGTLHACWSSKNSTYPNSFNIRYSKSTDGGATWSSAEQLTAQNVSGEDNTQPCIVVKDGIPYLFYKNAYGSGYAISCQYYASSSWKYTVVYDGGAWNQSTPCASVDNNGTIHVTWVGYDSIDGNVFNVRYTYSIDGGATWNTIEKLTSGTQNNIIPSITTDYLNNVYIMWSRYDEDNIYRLRKISKIDNTWGSIVELTPTATSHQLYPSICDNFKDFIEPLTIWRDDENIRVAFYGKWEE